MGAADVFSFVASLQIRPASEHAWFSIAGPFRPSTEMRDAQAAEFQPCVAKDRHMPNTLNIGLGEG